MKKTIVFLYLVFALVLIPFICVNLPLGSVECKTVRGSSMEPAITQNDIVVFTSEEKQLEVGDVISYKHLLENDEIITIAHRIIAITDEGYQTKGDSLAQKDGYIVSFEEVTGTMLFRIPYIAAIGHFTDTPIGFVILIFIPATILIARELEKIKPEDNTP